MFPAGVEPIQDNPTALSVTPTLNRVRREVPPEMIDRIIVRASELVASAAESAWQNHLYQRVGEQDGYWGRFCYYAFGRRPELDDTGRAAAINDVRDAILVPLAQRVRLLAQIGLAEIYARPIGAEEGPQEGDDILDDHIPFVHAGEWITDPCIVLKESGTFGVWPLSVVETNDDEQVVTLKGRAVEGRRAFQAPGIKLVRLAIEQLALAQVNARLSQGDAVLNGQLHAWFQGEENQDRRHLLRLAVVGMMQGIFVEAAQVYQECRADHYLITPELNGGPWLGRVRLTRQTIIQTLQQAGQG